MNTKGTITIVGAGNMGAAIATLCAAHGYRVVLNDQNDKMLASFAERAAPIARHMAGTERSPDEILSLVECNSSLEASTRDAFLVQEVIHEDLEAKRALFRRLDVLCAPEVMLATNTSSYLLSEICLDLAGRERVIGIHYVSPAHLIRAVEVITADFTGKALIERSRAFVGSIDHVAIVCKERPGFLINKIQYALKAECRAAGDRPQAGALGPDDAGRPEREQKDGARRHRLYPSGNRGGALREYAGPARPGGAGANRRVGRRRLVPLGRRPRNLGTGAGSAVGRVDRLAAGA